MGVFATFQDAIDHGFDYLGGTSSDAALRDIKRAILAAYRELVNAQNWSYLYRHGRIITNAPYGTVNDGSTFAYTQTGGTYERMVTLTGGMWPDWAAGGYLRVGVLQYRVDKRISATVLTLDDEVNPGADVAAGTEYTLFQDTYLLPEDYIAQDQALYEQNFGGMTYTHPRDWLYENRYVYAQGVPQCYTIIGDKQYPGRLTLKIFPTPTAAVTVDFVYKRRPRPLSIVSVSAGTVATASGTTTITGTGTSFSAAMVGSVIRIAGQNSSSKLPTSLVGDNPPTFESVITDYTSATSIAVADAAPSSLSGALYVVSDPIEIESGAMLNAFWRCVEMQIGMSRTLKDKPSARLQYQAALNEARSADSRSFSGRFAGPQQRIRQRFRDMPVGPDQS